ncbi:MULTISPECIES: response regulator transcription factor [Niveibacterium]|uniref:Response regulator transcription factor n=1 Tax=Niveibacterium microcysteis TaxID=2811415 RepID=A0ABX7M8U2_9RHOO|nr:MULTISPECIES: response regulator [Niveibacterium]QSI75902.1 response regulator transcription factor [Niveibacterium microcysteis]
MEPLVHIVDDDEAIRDALAWLLKSRRLACRTWSSGEDFLASLDASMRGCVVLDVRLGGMSGPECFEQMLERGVTLPVLFLTGHADVPMAVQLLRRGAWHFMEKPCNDNELVDLVQEALAFDARNRADQGSRANIEARLAALTPREQEVMNRILEGKLNKQIADTLDISMRTVEVHRARIFDKMGVRSAVELSQLLSPLRKPT